MVFVALSLLEWSPLNNPSAEQQDGILSTHTQKNRDATRHPYFSIYMGGCYLTRVSFLVVVSLEVLMVR